MTVGREVGARQAKRWTRERARLERRRSPVVVVLESKDFVRETLRAAKRICRRAELLLHSFIMASGKSRSRVWECPRCGNAVTLFVEATEVVCTNKTAHTSTAVTMERRKSRQKVA